MKIIITVLSVTVFCFTMAAQNNTDVSLFMRSDSAVYLEEVSSQTGDLYNTIGHHGPAVENEWLGLRIYFDHKCAIDVYSKTEPRLELKKARWYPSPDQQKNGWGADYYKVGNTVGLGGIRLWDGKQVIKLDPVSKRTARVMKQENFSCMEMISEGVSLKERKVDILIRVTVYSGQRNAKVEAVALTGGPVQFVTGINYHPDQEIVNKEGLIATWGLHPEDVAAESVKIGAALIYNPDHFREVKDDGTQILLISKPTGHLETWISSASAKEPEINSMKNFLEKLNHY